jgi:hypothetical protein
MKGDRSLVGKTGERGKRGKPIAGPEVAKALLWALREMRERETDQNPGTSVFFRDTEEIEAWEDVIRANVKTWSAAPREVLNLDKEATVALDEACGFHKPNFARTDAAREWRRTFALRAIKAVSQAWVDAAQEDRPWIDEMTVTLREMTEDEKAAELLAMKPAVDNSIA